MRTKTYSSIFNGLATIYVAGGFGILLSVADNSMRKSGTLPLPPTVAALVFMGSVICFVMLKDFLTSQPTARLGFLLRSNLAVIVPFAFLAFLSLALALHPTSFWGDERKWIYLQTYDFGIFLLAILLTAVEFIRKRYQFFVLVGLLTILGSVWYEVQNPGIYSSVPNRASGFPGNSNWGALVMVMICAVSLAYNDGRGRFLDLILFAITGMGLYFTFSRSGMINFVLLITFYVINALLSGRDRVKTASSMILAAFLLFSFFTFIVPIAADNSALMEDSKAENRLLGLFSGDLVDDGSSADRLEAATETLNMIESSPILGHGTGFNRKMRQTPHNLYLKLWVDSGIFGLITWLTLLTGGMWLFTSRRYPRGQALILVTFIGSFFSHNILEQRTFLLLFGTTIGISMFESATYAKTVFSWQKVAPLTKHAVF